MKPESVTISKVFKGAARSNGASAFVDQGLISGFNFATFLMLARWMEVSQFGIYVLAFSVLMFIQTFQHALVTRAHNVLGVRLEGDSFKHFTRSTLILTVLLAVCCTIVAVLFCLVFRAFGLDPFVAPALGIAISAIPWLIQDSLRRVLYTAGRVPAALFNDFISYGLQASLVGILFMMGTEGNVRTVFFILGLSSGVAVVVGVLQIKKEISGPKFSRSAFRADAQSIWNYGKWLSTGEFIGWLGQNGHTWLIGGLLGAPLVAGYRAATYVTNLLNPLDLAVSNYLPVKASQVLDEHGKEAMLSWLASRALWLCLPYGLIAAGISFGSFWLLDLFYDSRYVTELLALVLSITAWSRFLGFLVNFSRLGLMASERTVPILKSQVVSLIIFAVVSTLMIIWMGIAGAPLARIFLHVVIGLYLTHALRSDKGKVHFAKPAVAI